jgi:hypothetical protein
MMRRARLPGWLRGTVAVVAAYALALQALLGAAGASLAPAGQAEAGWYCAPDGGSPASGPQRSAPHGKLCCTLPCHGVGAGCPASAQPAFIRHAAIAAIAAGRTARPKIASSSLLPLGARAPPLAS